MRVVLRGKNAAGNPGAPEALCCHGHEIRKAE